MITNSNGEMHELRGNYDTFTYVSERKERWTESVALCGGCLIGYVSPSMLPHLRDILQGVTIVKHDRRFDCQTWIIMALRSLQKNGIVFRDMNEQKLRDELAADKERDETGHEVIYERIISSGMSI